MSNPHEVDECERNCCYRQNILRAVNLGGRDVALLLLLLRITMMRNQEKGE